MRLKPSESSEPSASSPRAWCSLNMLFRVHNLISSLLISSGEHAHFSRAVLGFFQDQETRCIIRPLVCPQSSDTNFSLTPPSTFRLSPAFHRAHQAPPSHPSRPLFSRSYVSQNINGGLDAAWQVLSRSAQCTRFISRCVGSSLHSTGATSCPMRSLAVRVLLISPLPMPIR
jgi:hypothetical protein